MQKPSVSLVRELRPGDGLGEGMDQLVALVHHAYLFWAGGQRVRSIDRAGLDLMLATDLPPDLHDDALAWFLQLPERRMWAQALEDSAHEPLDGIFVHHSTGGALRVLGVLRRSCRTRRIHRGGGGRAARGREHARRLGAIQQCAAWRRSGRPVLRCGDERTDRARLAFPGTRASTGRGGLGTLMMTTPGSLSHVDKKSAAQVLEQIASFLELKGENPFRIRAFRTASKTVAGLPGELAPALADGTLASTKGIGPATLQILLELVTNGRASLLEDLRDQVPPGLVDMLQIPGLGVAKIRQIHDTLRIDSLPSWRRPPSTAASRKLPRFGQKTAENILKGIRFLRQASAWRSRTTPRRRRRCCARALGQLKGVRQAIVAGDVRRRTEVVRDVVIVLTRRRRHRRSCSRS